ncbi:MAG: hypothetical protein CMN04_07325 [Roseibacillus sp.]|nr:hypothetical protein [Roseibacillus sp.]|tara:strand:+ start:11647 stop:14328 length:2682 start_codon:yes stop_codon:yes gene_type:complete
MKLKSFLGLPLTLLVASAQLVFSQDGPDDVTTTPGRISTNIAGADLPGIPGDVDFPPAALHIDLGDAPDNALSAFSNSPSYPTHLASGGAYHHVVTQPGGFRLTLGNWVDAEMDGQPHAAALGDDSLGPLADEDGVVFIDPLISGLNVTIQVWASGTGKLDAFFDYNKNGSWMDPGEYVFNSEPLVAGLNVLSFVVPPSALLGDTFARFRLSSSGVSGPTGMAPDGEVEDYLIKIDDDTGSIPNVVKDWGDAPEGNSHHLINSGVTANYPVTDANGGASHILSNDLCLGMGVDSEPDGMPGASAYLDDFDYSINDEDGILFPSGINAGVNAPIQVVVNMPSKLDAWIDFNGDGDWLDSGEQIFTSEPVVGGLNTLSFPVPQLATSATYARFRISMAGGLTPSGEAPDGEVEDYRIDIGSSQLADEDWGDAPEGLLLASGVVAQYPVTSTNNGARHMLGSDIYLGTRVDSEPNGQPDQWAEGDDLAGIDDEDGVFFGVLQQGTIAQIGVVASNAGFINAFLDANADGDWNDPGEVVVLNGLAVAGMNVYNFTVPSSAATGNTFLRVRINSTGGLGPAGPAADGEVEDYVIHIKPGSPVLVDWGDAPNSYSTLAGSSGPSHEIDALFLGKKIDPEPDGQPSLVGLGDDFDGNDDEDGVRFLTPMVSGSYALVRIYPTFTGILDAWIDFNGDGVFSPNSQSTERIFNSVTVNPGQVLVFKVPKIKKPLKTFARFRLSHGGSSYNGHQIGGEVEDYQVKVGKKSGWILEPKLPNMLALNWDAEPGMDYIIQNSATPQEWIQENLGEREVPRVDELFPAGVAWDSLPTGDEGGEVPAVGEGNHPVLWDLSMMRPEADGGPSQVRPWRVGPREPVKMSREFGINRSKTLSLFRVIAMPE